MGWAISLQPSSAEVLAALRDALVVQPGRGSFGGVPGGLRWDHGLEFAAGAVEHAALGVDVDPATATAQQPDPVELTWALRACAGRAGAPWPA